jgi:hypothetical protein
MFLPGILNHSPFQARYKDFFFSYLNLTEIDFIFKNSSLDSHTIKIPSSYVQLGQTCSIS